MGLLSAGYIRLFHTTAATFERMKLPISAKLGIGLVAVGLIAIPLPQNLSDGYPVINAALAGQLHVPRMAMLAIAKIFASCLSLGCGAPGGVFGPIFFIGAMGGGSFRAVSESFLPHLTGPRGSYALVGLGAFLAGTTHAPLTAVFLLFEMTREYEITVPALLTSILSLVVARAIESESIDTFSLARQGKTLHIGRDRQLLMQIPVSAAMNPTPDLVRSNDSFSEVLRKAGETTQVNLPVVDHEDALLGVIATRELLSLVTSREDLANLGIAADVCENNPPTLGPDENLDDATRLLEAEGVEEVSVTLTGEHSRLVGLLSRNAIRNALSRAAVSLAKIARSDEPIAWSADYRVAQIGLGSALKGKSIRQLNARSRFGINVVAVRNGHNLGAGFGSADPDRPLELGDLLLVAGSPNSVRAFEREAVSHGSQSLKEPPTQERN
jgi:CIC family chloride channel protein